MAIKIKSLKQAVGENGLKILVYGPAGSGKTVLCATTREPTLIISAEAGLLSIKDAPDYIKIATVGTIGDIEEIYEELLDGHPFKWVMVDSVSEIGEVILSDEKAETKDQRQAYMTLADKLNKLLRNFRDLPDVNVVMTAKQQRFTDDITGVTTYYPSLPSQKLSTSISYLFDEVFALQVYKDDEGETFRQLQTERDISYEAKDRSGKLEEFENANLAYIFNKIHGDKKITKKPQKKKTKKQKDKTAD